MQKSEKNLDFAGFCDGLVEFWAEFDGREGSRGLVGLSSGEEAGGGWLPWVRRIGKRGLVGWGSGERQARAGWLEFGREGSRGLALGVAGRLSESIQAGCSSVIVWRKAVMGQSGGVASNSEAMVRHIGKL